MREADLNRHEWIEERAAILEHEANYPRDVAEVMARLQWNQRQEAECART